MRIESISRPWSPAIVPGVASRGVVSACSLVNALGICWSMLLTLTYSRFDTTSLNRIPRSEEHTSELQSLMRISYAVFCLKKKKKQQHTTITTSTIQYHHQH